MYIYIYMYRYSLVHSKNAAWQQILNAHVRTSRNVYSTRWGPQHANAATLETTYQTTEPTFLQALSKVWLETWQFGGILLNMEKGMAGPQKKRQPKDELVCFLITVTAKWRMWLGWPTVATMFFLTWHPSSNNMTRHKMFLNSPCRCDSWNAQHGRWLWTCCFVSVVVGASAQDRRISPRQRWQKVHREAAEEHSAIWNLQNVVRWKSHI